MLAWSTIAYGAIVSAVLATAAAALLMRTGRLPVALTVGLCALAGPLVWNSILRATHAREFFTDAPLVVLPASWQDTGSRVFTPRSPRWSSAWDRWRKCPADAQRSWPAWPRSSRSPSTSTCTEGR